MFTVTQLQQEAAAAEKARGKHQERAAMVGRDLAADPETEGLAAPEGEAGAAKNFRARGITEGPGDGTEPGHLLPEDVDRGYVDAGHAAQSPMSGPPRTNPSPLPAWPRGVPQPVQMPGGPAVQGIPAHIAAGLTLGSPSDR